ncbi:unnamed protein product [Cercospora beticola]|nr:unnamed protein product [Cercospora beticola]
MILHLAVFPAFLPSILLVACSLLSQRGSAFAVSQVQFEDGVPAYEPVELFQHVCLPSGSQGDTAGGVVSQVDDSKSDRVLERVLTSADAPAVMRMAILKAPRRLRKGIPSLLQAHAL